MGEEGRQWSAVTQAGRPVRTLTPARSTSTSLPALAPGRGALMHLFSQPSKAGEAVVASSLLEEGLVKVCGADRLKPHFSNCQSVAKTGGVSIVLRQITQNRNCCF